MRIEKSAYEKRIQCHCGCVFCADEKDFRGDGLMFEVICPQCHAVHALTLVEYVELFDRSRYRYGEVKIGEVSKTRADKQRIGAVQATKMLVSAKSGCHI